MQDGIRGQLDQYPEISFIEDISFQELLTKMIQDYQDRYKELTGKEMELAAADPIRLILYSCAVAIYQGYQYEDQAGKMGLLKYSRGKFLDNLGALKKVQRNPASSASTVIRFTLSQEQDFAVAIPAGTRVKAGELFFATQEYAEIPPGEVSKDLLVVCQTPGEIGNGYEAGEIKVLVDPINYVESVENTTRTAGGADEETDDALAERIYLAPSSYSTAGPEDGYRYWTMTYSTAIKDCYITSEKPGEVDVYVMLENGEIPEEGFLQGLEDFLNHEEIKPLTDLVQVKAPEEITYTITGTYYISSENRDMAETIQENVKTACDNYVQWQQAAIGRDLNPSKLIYYLMAAGAKWVNLQSPVFTTIQKGAVAKVTEINLTYGGIQDD